MLRPEAPIEMPSLATSQKVFTKALLDPDQKVPNDVTSVTTAVPLQRFNVYRNNVIVSLLGVIRARYPVIERLVGEEFFATLGRLFLEAHPPRSPVLLTYGGGFADFLETIEELADYPYLPDVARLEWARHEVYHAADAMSASLADLALIPPERMHEIRLNLLPCVRLVSSPFPVAAIWHTNTHDEDVVSIEAEEGDHCLIVRKHDQVLILPVEAATMVFAQALANGETLGSAADKAFDANPEFDLSVALNLLFTHEAMASLVQPDASLSQEERKIDDLASRSV